MAKKSTRTRIDSIKHQDKRTNIPTEELRDFVADDEKTPEKLLYPRDTSLDPQLVWRGKDEQDSRPLEVEAPPIYIQEKIHPRALIEEFRLHAGQNDSGEQMPLFESDFNGISFEQMIEFYQHEQSWSNRMILGDSLAVMASLAEKEGLKGKVQMIYIDPPYGIKFGSNWQVSTRKRDVKDTRLEDLTRQPEQIRAFRDTWQLGLHSYLSYLRARLIAARDLLAESGSVFVQIGNENVHLVRSLIDEVFGSENFCSMINYRTSAPLTSVGLGTITDYILWYAKDISLYKYHDLFLEREGGEKSRYSGLELFTGTRRGLTPQEKAQLDLLPEGSRLYADMDLASSGYTPSCIYPYEYHGKIYQTSSGKSWKTTRDGMDRLGRAGRITDSGVTIRYILYYEDFPVTKLTNSWMDTTGELAKTYVVQTHTKVVERCLLMTTDPGDLVLDPTCGGGTTAYAAEQWGRRWITIDTSRVSLALARSRLMAARYPYYLLADTQEGINLESELTGQWPPAYQTSSDIRKGFIYKRAFHITLKSIAQNGEIDTIYSEWQPHIEGALATLNRLMSTNWREWEVPEEAGPDWMTEPVEWHAKFWELRRGRQAAIDASISRGADIEFLYDQPYEDSKRLRVCGPFTVESLSPYRMLSTDEPMPASQAEAQQNSETEFVRMILDNLKKAGVQNTFRNERLTFDRLEPYAGEHLDAVGEYTDGEGNLRRAAIHIGPKYGTVAPDHLKEAAKEAVQGVGFDVLVMCGFAFDPHVSEESRRYGNLQVLIARMNPDLMMGEDLLKKTGAGNLFMVFGEPDIRIERLADGQIQIGLQGLDIYDPNTGEIRSNTTDDIACWFVDTNYNGESFFVRHAYFTGADKPYDNLKRALRAEINEEAWASLYSTVSRPFPVPETGKVAVKVINHYGDEVLKVYEIAPS